MARRRARRPQTRSGALPLDRWAITLMIGLTVVVGLLLLSGDHASARVRSFSWQERQVGAEDTAFLMLFNRPMDPVSVEENLTITPPLPGKVSWAGRRMAYTLDVPAPYGEAFTVSIDRAQDKFAAKENQPGRFEGFQGRFQSRNRAFVYIGTTGEEAGRLVMSDLTEQKQKILTPENLVVMDFKPYPLGDRILISATDAAAYQAGELDQQLYTVTTGLNPLPPEDFATAGQGIQWFRRRAQPAPAGEMTLLLDSQGYQNLKFDLAPDGQTVVVQRVNQEDSADFGLWVLQDGKAPRPLETEPGGDFLIAPDSQSVLLLQGQGTGIIPLEENPETGKADPLDFLPEYGQVFDLKSDGTAAAMVNFNQNDPERRFTRSLFLVTNQGKETELLNATGSISDAQFDPTNRILYVLASELLPGDTYVEQPILSAINLKDNSLVDLLLLPTGQQIHMSVSPDGLALLLDLSPINVGDPTTQADTGEQIWLLPLFTTTEERLAGLPVQNQPEKLPFQGLQATWLP